MVRLGSYDTVEEALAARLGRRADQAAAGESAHGRRGGRTAAAEAGSGGRGRRTAAAAKDKAGVGFGRQIVAEAEQKTGGRGIAK